jgi:microcystin degradation protein MlrC
VADEVIEQFWNDIAPLAAKADYDAIYLVLHGAMTSQTILDVEGEILRRLRAITQVPIFGVFDLHANFSPQDGRTGRLPRRLPRKPAHGCTRGRLIAARLLNRCLTTGQRPRMQIRQPGLIWPPTGTGTANDPMFSLEAMARQFERRKRLAVVDEHRRAGFSFADTPDTGVSFVACTTDDASRTARRTEAQRAHELATSARSPIRLRMRCSPVSNRLPEGLTVLVEPSDNIGGGAPGDCTGLLRALIRHGVRKRRRLHQRSSSRARNRSRQLAASISAARAAGSICRSG